MLADKLRLRVERVAELNRLLTDDPGSADAGAWISEISEKTLNRTEERHLAVVSQVRRLLRRIEVVEAMPDGVGDLDARRDDLQERVDAMDDGGSKPRFAAKLAQIDQRIADGGDCARQRARLSVMQRKVALLKRSPDLLTKEDVLDG